MVTLGVRLAEMLSARGVEHVFGIPGVHNQELYRGLPGSGIQHILARHEQGAAFMADGYARATGRPGVVFLISGPGLLNALTPLGQAYSDSVPVLAVSSCLDETAANRGQLHQMRDQRMAGQTVCDWSEEARNPDAAFTLIDRALTEFQSKRKRSKHVQIPISVLEAEATQPPENSRVASPKSIAQAKVEEVADAINNAQTPLFIFGGGAVSVGREVATELVDRAGGAAFSTYAGRGLMPGDHRLNFGSFLGRPSSVDHIANADLVVVFGSELSETDLWRRELGHTSPMIRVDVDPEVLVDIHRAELPVQADAAFFIEALLPLIKDLGGHSNWSAEAVDKARAAWQSEADAVRPGIVPICAFLADRLPEDTMIYSDMTQFAYVAKEVWNMPRPGHWHHPTGFGTLGYALPAAIGGKIGRGDAPVIALAGDYGLQYTLPELAVAVELRLSLPIVVWDNSALGEIRDSMIAAQIAPNAVEVKNPDFLALAQAYGAASEAPSTLSALHGAIETAFSAGRPTLIRIGPGLT